ncbi:MAG: branched-chain amino acid ABC transporter substrate-binding protein [Sterolibacteriaceae bacterium]|uniref:Branched-chain amino acid ABC transporter substrate-binding protein n=1 Tax=Candidatus Methylophosphatis roskildensis TaxID=2899263 RepID=A0A9D7HUV5_9PROT|nr:branched-chain amino acid ABC transporter substrate-binding protein [Candidatus Methylophosphatis roskildensis]MBK7234679.1 branched-chain amino acid ABC transporter substrate-binding protein [Sterolibacteriaceae bacterium]
MRKRTLSSHLIALLAACLAACDKPAPPPGAELAGAARIARLGFAAPLTGPQAHYGNDMRNGVLLALEETNATHPRIGGAAVRFELLAEDDQADPRQATAVAQKLVDARIAGMLGHFNSGTSIPASRIYAQAGIAQIAMATAPGYTAQGFKTSFRAMTSDSQQGSVLGRYLVRDMGATRIAIIDDRTAYGQGLADEFEKAALAAGASVVRREFTDDRATDFTGALTAIKSANPDLLFFGGADVQAAPMVRQMRSLGLTALFAGGEMVKSPNFIALAGDAAQGALASLAGLPLERMPGGSAYAERYRERFGSAVELYSPYAYDAAMAMIGAMRRADSIEPSRYLKELADTRMAGVTSPRFAWDERGDLQDGGITIYRVERGAWVPIVSSAGS